MNFRIVLVLFVVMAWVLTGCEPEEQPNPDNAKLNIVGFWTAQGGDIAPTLADTVNQMTLRFRTDSTYTMVQTTALGLSSTYSGTYSVQKLQGANDIYPFTLKQTSPVATTFKGIFEINEVIEPEELTLEYVQTLPNAGYTPPTPDYGFGSTNDGNLGTTNISRFQRVE